MNILRMQTEIELRLLWRQRETIFFGLVLPLMFLVFVGIAFRSGVYKGYTSADDLIPPYLVMAVMSIAIVNMGISFAGQRANGSLKRLGGTPLPRLTLLIAKTISSAVFIALACVLLLLLAMSAFGSRVHGNAAATVLILAVGIVAFSAIGIALGGTIQADGAAAVTNAIYLPLLFLGGSLIPVNSMPTVVRDIALVFPSAHLVGALQTVLVQGRGLGATGWDVPLVALWGLVAAAVAARGLRWE